MNKDELPKPLKNVDAEESNNFDLEKGFYNQEDIKLDTIPEKVSLSQISNPLLKELFKYLPQEKIKNIILSREQYQDLLNSVAGMAQGYIATLPKICDGSTCIYGVSCPLLKAAKKNKDYSILPIGEMCPFEILVINRAILEYSRDLDLKWENKVDRIYIMELVEYEIYDMRTNADIANNRYIMENIIGITEDKEPIIHLEKSIAIDVKMAFKRNREKILDALLATPKSKKDKPLPYDAAQYSADLRRAYEEKLKQEIIEKKKLQAELLKLQQKLKTEK